LNGVHDMGGMQGFGPVAPEENQAAFHEPWEVRVHALRRAVGATGKVPPVLRPAIESLPPADYLSFSYYERWLAALIDMLTASGVVTREEVEAGKAAAGHAKSAPGLSPIDAAGYLLRTPPDVRPIDVKPRYAIGQAVRARIINPAGHTRLPRYVRGRRGAVQQYRGVQAFPDTFVYGLGDNPQPVYSVRFAARELWGGEASERDSVYLDLWEDYLEPA
jgi:nitrile hydratase beta subunit